MYNVDVRVRSQILSSYIYMTLQNIFERATDFGTFRSRDNFFSFAIKTMLYIIPALILGTYTDATIQTLHKYKL